MDEDKGHRVWVTQVDLKNNIGLCNRYDGTMEGGVRHLL